MTSQKISPLDEGKGVIVSRRQSFLTRRKITSPSLTSLNIDKFDQALSPNFTSGFEESEDCFTEITSKAATLIGAERCLLFIKDTKEQKLYTFIKDNEGNKVRATKPIDRGITGSILSEPSGYHEKIDQCDRWSKELDELPNFVTTCYLAWPIWDFAAQKSVGVVEFRNKSGNGISFSPADLQFARIIALQLGHAVIHYKQQEREYFVILYGVCLYMMCTCLMMLPYLTLRTTTNLSHCWSYRGYTSGI